MSFRGESGRAKAVKIKEFIQNSIRAAIKFEDGKIDIAKAESVISGNIAGISDLFDLTAIQVLSKEDQDVGHYCLFWMGGASYCNMKPKNPLTTDARKVTCQECIVYERKSKKQKQGPNKN